MRTNITRKYFEFQILERTSLKLEAPLWIYGSDIYRVRQKNYKIDFRHKN